MSVEIYTPVTQSKSVLVRNLGEKFKRSHHLYGGPYDGSIPLSGGKGVFVSEFDGWLGYDVRENSGRTWRGLIYEMSRTIGPINMLISMNEMANSVRVSYDNNGETAYTSYFTDTNSVSQYGTIQLTLESSATAAADANEIAQTELAKRAWPSAKPVGITPGVKGEQLNIKTAGYAYTLRWLYPDVDALIAAGNNTCSELVEAIANSSTILSAGNIENNTLSVSSSLRGNALTIIKDICSMGDASNNPWHFYIDEDLKLHYQPINTTPTFMINNDFIGYDRGAKIKGGEQELLPGIWRAANLPSREIPGWPGRSDLMLVERVTTAVNGRVSFGVTGYEEYDIVQAQSRLGDSQT